jgi:hypothetical protein
MNRIPQDKLIHFLGGAFIASAVFGLTGMFSAAVAAAVTIGVAKEAWDAMGYGTPDIWDAVATAAGASVLLAWAIPPLL